MAGGNTVTLNFAGDSKKLEKAFDNVGDSAKDMARDLDKSEKTARSFSGGMDKAGAAAGGSETAFMGTADVLDGLATTMGFNIGAQIEMARGFGDMAGGLANLGPMFGGLITKLGAMIGLTTTQTAVTGAATGAQTGLNTALAANPIGAIVVGIGLLIGALVLAYKTSETFRDIVKGAFDLVMSVIGPVIDAIGNAIGWVVGLFKGANEEVEENVDLVAAEFERIKTLLEAQRSKWVAWKDSVTASINGILDPLQNAREQSKVGFDEIGKNLADNVKFFEGWMTNLRTLVSRGFGALAEEMYKLGPTAEKAVGEAVKKSDAELTKMTGLFGQKGQAADTAFTTAFLSNEGLKAMGHAGTQYGLQFKQAFSSSTGGGIGINVPIGRIGPSQPTQVRAGGGPVAAGHPYVVGEAGPELFVPGHSGGIIPNGGAGGTTINVYGSVVSEAQLVDIVHRGLLRKQSVTRLGIG